MNKTFYYPSWLYDKMVEKLGSSEAADKWFRSKHTVDEDYIILPHLK